MSLGKKSRDLAESRALRKIPGDFPRHLAPAAPAATLRADDVESND